MTLQGRLQTRSSLACSAKCQGCWPCHRLARRMESYSLHIQDSANGTMSNANNDHCTDHNSMNHAKTNKTSPIGSRFTLCCCLLHACFFQMLSATVSNSAINKWNQWQPQININQLFVKTVKWFAAWSGCTQQKQIIALQGRPRLKSLVARMFAVGAAWRYTPHIPWRIWPGPEVDGSQLKQTALANWLHWLQKALEKDCGTKSWHFTIQLTNLLIHDDPGFNLFRFWPSRIAWSRMRNVEYIGIGARPGK